MNQWIPIACEYLKSLNLHSIHLLVLTIINATKLLKRICLSAYKKSYITLFYLLKGIAYGPSALGNQGVAYFSNGRCFYSKCLHIHREMVSPRLKCRNSRNPAHNWWISFINSIRLTCGRKCVRMVSYRSISFTILRKGQRSFS